MNFKYLLSAGNKFDLITCSQAPDIKYINHIFCNIVKNGFTNNGLLFRRYNIYLYLNIKYYVLYLTPLPYVILWPDYFKPNNFFWKTINFGRKSTSNNNFSEKGWFKGLRIPAHLWNLNIRKIQVFLHNISKIQLEEGWSLDFGALWKFSFFKKKFFFFQIFFEFFSINFSRFSVILFIFHH